MFITEKLKNNNKKKKKTFQIKVLVQYVNRRTGI